MKDGSNYFAAQVKHWCTQNDIRMVDLFIDGNKEIIEDCIVIACGQSPRGTTKEHRHAVVWCNEIIHDPHPSRDGLVGDPEFYTITFPLNPKQLFFKKI